VKAVQHLDILFQFLAVLFPWKLPFWTPPPFGVIAFGAFGLIALWWGFGVIPFWLISL